MGHMLSSLLTQCCICIDVHVPYGLLHEVQYLNIHSALCLIFTCLFKIFVNILSYILYALKVIVSSARLLLPFVIQFVNTFKLHLYV